VSEQPGLDLEAALRDLDRATKSFAERLGAASAAGPEAETAAPSPPTAPAPEPARAETEPDGQDHLTAAKHRVDRLVDAMVVAVEREAATIRAEIRSEREAAGAEAERRIEEAREVADRMVSERQRQIAEAGDGLVERARALAAGMEDAERIGSQFEAFMRELSAAAARIATDDRGREPPGQEPGEPRSLAA
jgi:hypothetical protein